MPAVMGPPQRLQPMVFAGVDAVAPLASEALATVAVAALGGRAEGLLLGALTGGASSAPRSLLNQLRAARLDTDPHTHVAPTVGVRVRCGLVATGPADQEPVGTGAPWLALGDRCGERMPVRRFLGRS